MNPNSWTLSYCLGWGRSKGLAPTGPRTRPRLELAGMSCARRAHTVFEKEVREYGKYYKPLAICPQTEAVLVIYAYILIKHGVWASLFPETPLQLLQLCMVQINHETGTTYHILRQLHYDSWCVNLLRVIWPLRLRPAFFAIGDRTARRGSTLCVHENPPQLPHSQCGKNTNPYLVVSVNGGFRFVGDLAIRALVFGV